MSIRRKFALSHLPIWKICMIKSVVVCICHVNAKPTLLLQIRNLTRERDVLHGRCAQLREDMHEREVLAREQQLQQLTENDGYRVKIKQIGDDFAVHQTESSFRIHQLERELAYARINIFQLNMQTEELVCPLSFI